MSTALSETLLTLLLIGSHSSHIRMGEAVSAGRCYDCRAEMIRKARDAEDKRIAELRAQLQLSRKPRHGAKAH